MRAVHGELERQLLLLALAALLSLLAALHLLAKQTSCSQHLYIFFEVLDDWVGLHTARILDPFVVAPVRFFSLQICPNSQSSVETQIDSTI